MLIANGQGVDVSTRGKEFMLDRTKLDLTKTVYELCTEHPDLVDVLVELGFSDITKPGMLQSAGRFMTIPKGAMLRKRDLEELRAAFAERGYDTYWSTAE